jgi:ABC-2 type transport system ATP-binding protein
VDVSALALGFDGREVVRDVTLRLGAGETTRLAGANGAGKSTVLRGIAGAQAWMAGSVAILGHPMDTEPERAKALLGFSTGACPFPYLTGAEHLELATRIHGLAPDAWTWAVDRFADWACVGALDVEVRTYSHGMRQQLAFLLAVAHRPSLLLLDEAVDGLDEVSLIDCGRFLAERADAGAALIYVAHRDEVAAAFPPARQYRVVSSTNPERT